jgi:DNA-directed RNA polymerase subunit L
MELNITKETKKELAFEAKGMGNTFCNLLKETLYTIEGVEAASYSIDHPLVNIPRFIIVTDGKEDPKAVLLKAVKAMKAQNAKMEKLVSAMK